MSCSMCQWCSREFRATRTFVWCQIEWCWWWKKSGETAPVEVGSWNPIIYRVWSTSQVVIAGFLNHQQYWCMMYVMMLMILLYIVWYIGEQDEESGFFLKLHLTEKFEGSFFVQVWSWRKVILGGLFSWSHHYLKAMAMAQKIFEPTFIPK